MSEALRCEQFYLGNSGLGWGVSWAKHLISMPKPLGLIIN